MTGRGGPELAHELELARQAGGLVCGVDEAGRGPLAGPVIAAAVILDPARIPAGLDDSKRLTAERRAALYEELCAVAHVAVGIGDVERIDRDNILQATLWAMNEAVRALAIAPAAALVDGDRAPKLPCPARTLVGGDGLSLCVAAASIVAKVTRDRLMIALAGEHAAYGWERNMGYGTPEHQAALARAGVSPHHRRSFAPVRALLEQA